MATVVGVVAETRPGERRTALVPAAVARLVASDFRVVAETGCGDAAGFTDLEFARVGAEIVDSGEVFRRARVIACVTAPHRLAPVRRGQLMVGMLQPWRHPVLIDRWLRRGVTMVSLDRVPPVPEAAGLDPTTVQARITGRQAVLLAEQPFGGSFPMMTAGVVRPVRVLVLGGGVIGLQAMSTARLLGADVTGYTGRVGGVAAITARGARVLRLGASLIDEDGVPREPGDQERLARRHLLDLRIGQFDVVITAAGKPGSRPPRLVSAEAVVGMRPGSVIVDVAAGRYGGNVAGSRPDVAITVRPGVRLIGAGNLPSQAAGLASEYYADAMVTAIRRLCPDGEPLVDPADPLWSAMVLGESRRQGRRAEPVPVVSVLGESRRQGRSAEPEPAVSVLGQRRAEGLPARDPLPSEAFGPSLPVSNGPVLTGGRSRF